MDILEEKVINYIIHCIQWDYQYDPWITADEYNDHPVLSIFLLYILAIFTIRQFLNGMGMHFLTKRQCQKKLRNASLRERLTYSRLRDEIPTGWMGIYWGIIIFYPSMMFLVVLFQLLYGTDPFIEYVIQLLVKIILFAFGICIGLVLILFYAKGNSLAYDRWLVDPKTRKAKRISKHKQGNFKKERGENKIKRD